MGQCLNDETNGGERAPNGKGSHWYNRSNEWSAEEAANKGNHIAQRISRCSNEESDVQFPAKVEHSPGEDPAFNEGCGRKHDEKCQHSVSTQDGNNARIVMCSLGDTRITGRACQRDVNVVGQDLIVGSSTPKPPPGGGKQQNSGKKWQEACPATLGDPKGCGAKCASDAAHVEKTVKANERTRFFEKCCSGANVHLGINRPHHNLHSTKRQRKAEEAREGNERDEEDSPQGQNCAQHVQRSSSPAEVASGRASCSTSGDANGEKHPKAGVREPKGLLYRGQGSIPRTPECAQGNEGKGDDPRGGFEKGSPHGSPFPWGHRTTLPGMSNALLTPDVAQRVLQAATSHGGEWAEIFVEDRANVGASLDDGRVEELSSGRSRGAGIRVLVGETVGFAHTADLSEASLLNAVAAAASVATGREGSTRAIDLTPGGAFPTTVSILPSTIGKQRKLDLLFAADDAARAAGSEIAQVTVQYNDSRRRIVVANTDGVFEEDDQVRIGFMVMAVANGDTGLQTGFQVFRRTEGFEVLSEDLLRDLANKAANQAITKLSARPAPSGELPIVLAGGSGGMLFHEACGHGLEADLIVKDTSLYAGRVGTQVASKGITLVDDSTMAGEWGTTRIDDEGAKASSTTLIEDGVLTDYMWDFLRARKTGRESSSGNGRRQSYAHLPMVRMTNTYLLAGTEHADDIVASTERGIYVKQLGGGQVDTATGDFVFGTSESYLIENGEITVPLRDANLIGNGPEILSRIDAVADDFSMTTGTCGKDGQSVPVGCGQPTLRITSCTVGGTA